MKRENHISKLIRESGVIHAPDNFTDAVMDKIEALQGWSDNHHFFLSRSGCHRGILYRSLGRIVWHFCQVTPVGASMATASVQSGIFETGEYLQRGGCCPGCCFFANSCRYRTEQAKAYSITSSAFPTLINPSMARSRCSCE